MAHAAKPEAHGNFAGQCSDGSGRDGVNATLLRMAGIVKPVLFLCEFLAAAARSHDDAHATKLIAGHGLRLEAGIHYRFFHRRHRERNGARNVRAIFRVYVAVFIEAHHFTRHLHSVAGGIEPCDPLHAADAFAGGPPEIITAYSIWTDGSYTGDNDSTWHSLFGDNQRPIFRRSTDTPPDTRRRSFDRTPLPFSFWTV